MPAGCPAMKGALHAALVLLLILAGMCRVLAAPIGSSLCAPGAGDRSWLLVMQLRQQLPAEVVDAVLPAEDACEASCCSAALPLGPSGLDRRLSSHEQRVLEIGHAPWASRLAARSRGPPALA